MNLSLNRKKIVILAGIVVLIAAIIVLRSLGRMTSSGNEVGQIKRGTIVDAVYGIGTVTANKNYQLKIGVTSNIRKLYVREGDQVKQGAPLVYIEGTSLFSAPFAGTITALPYKEGETVFPQTPVMTVTDLRDRYIVVSLQQQAVLRVEKKQTAVLSFESMRDQKFSGEVRSIYSSGNQFLVNIDVTGLPAKILPGMTVDVSIVIKKKENTLLIPVVGLNGGKASIKRGSKVLDVPVQLGVVDSDLAEIVSGDVQEGDSVVIKGK